MASTITTQQVINYAATNVELMPLSGVGGYTSEPALSILQDVLAEIFSPPYNWKFNRKTANLFVMQQGRSDYLFAGATAFTLTGANVKGGAGIDLKTASGITRSGSTVTVNTLEAHNFAVGDVVYLKGVADAGYDSTETISPSSSAWSNGYTILTTPTSTSFTFTIVGTPTTPSGASGIADFGWLEAASYVDETDNASPRYLRYLAAVRSLEPDWLIGTPAKIAVYPTSTSGVLSVRVRPGCSSAPLGATLVYQAKAPVPTDLNGTWSPIPDEFAFMYRQLFLAHAYRQFNSGRANEEYQKAEMVMQKALGRDDAEQSEEHITPASPIMSWGGHLGWL